MIGPSEIQLYSIYHTLRLNVDRPCLNSQLRVLGTNCQEIYVSSQHLHSLRAKHLLTWRTWTAPITFVQVKRRFYSIILKKILLFNCKPHAFIDFYVFFYWYPIDTSQSLLIY